MQTLIGYARCSTDRQDLAAQRHALAGLGVTAERIYLDHGLTGTNRNRPALGNALAAVREGDTFVVTKLDRLARSTQDANDIIGKELAAKGVKFQMAATVYDWDDPFAKMFLQMLAVIAEFEAGLIRMRTREGMAVAKAKGRLKGKPPKLSPDQQKLLIKAHESGEHSIAKLGEMFGVSRPTVYRVLGRERAINSV